MRFTACILRKPVEKRSWSYHDDPKKRISVAQMYELTRDDRSKLNERLVGIPVLQGHKFELGTLGRVVKSWINPADDSWLVEIELDQQSCPVWITEAIRAGVLSGVSLKHDRRSMTPVEVSLCCLPMREGTNIVELFPCPSDLAASSSALTAAAATTALKSQQYTLQDTISLEEAWNRPVVAQQMSLTTFRSGNGAAGVTSAGTASSVVTNPAATLSNWTQNSSGEFNLSPGLQQQLQNVMQTTEQMNQVQTQQQKQAEMADFFQKMQLWEKFKQQQQQQQSQAGAMSIEASTNPVAPTPAAAVEQNKPLDPVVVASQALEPGIPSNAQRQLQAETIMDLVESQKQLQAENEKLKAETSTLKQLADKSRKHMQETLQQLLKAGIVDPDRQQEAQSKLQKFLQHADSSALAAHEGVIAASASILQQNEQLRAEYEKMQHLMNEVAHSMPVQQQQQQQQQPSYSLAPTPTLPPIYNRIAAALNHKAVYTQAATTPWSSSAPQYIAASASPAILNQYENYNQQQKRTSSQLSSSLSVPPQVGNLNLNLMPPALADVMRESASLPDASSKLSATSHMNTRGTDLMSKDAFERHQKAVRAQIQQSQPSSSETEPSDAMPVIA